MNDVLRLTALLKANSPEETAMMDELIPPPVADWSKLPEDWKFGDATAFIQLLDGYELASELFPEISGDEPGIGAAKRVFEAALSALRNRQIEQICALQIWVGLFFQCRSDRWNEIDPKALERPELDELLHHLKVALKQGRYFPAASEDASDRF